MVGGREGKEERRKKEGGRGRGGEEEGDPNIYIL